MREPHLTAPWSIRAAVAADAATLSAVAERIFRDTFTAGNDAADIDRYCATAFSPEIQAREIADPKAHTFLVEVGEALVAFAQIESASLNPTADARPGSHLRRFYVDRPWHGTGLARDLMGAVVRHAVEGGAKELWLAVWEHNDRAIAFYRRVGFTVSGEQTFQLGNEVQRDLVMSHALQSKHAPGE